MNIMLSIITTFLAIVGIITIVCAAFGAMIDGLSKNKLEAEYQQFVQARQAEYRQF